MSNEAKLTEAVALLTEALSLRRVGECEMVGDAAGRSWEDDTEAWLQAQLAEPVHHCEAGISPHSSTIHCALCPPASA